MLTIRGLGVVLGSLAEMGYNARWGVLGNGDVGPDKVGERIWIAATTERGGWPKILRGEIRQRRDASEEPAPAVDADSQDWTPRLRALENLVGEPAILGSRDGLADQVERLRAIGNGQFPALVELAWQTLTQPNTPDL